MGEWRGWLFEPTYNRSIKLPQADCRITSDAGGVLVLREMDLAVQLAEGFLGVGERLAGVVALGDLAHPGLEVLACSDVLFFRFRTGKKSS